MVALCCSEEALHFKNSPRPIYLFLTKNSEPSSVGPPGIGSKRRSKPKNLGRVILTSEYQPEPRSSPPLGVQIRPLPGTYGAIYITLVLDN